MVSMNMGSVYCNPYMSATGIPYMPVAQYSPYGAFRPGMRLVPFVPMPSPTLGYPSGILPLVQGPTEIPVTGTISIPDLQPTNTAMQTLNPADQSKESPPFKELKKDACGSQEASTSGRAQVILYRTFIKLQAIQWCFPSNFENIHFFCRLFPSPVQAL